MNPVLGPGKDEVIRKWLAQQMGQSKQGPPMPTAGINMAEGGEVEDFGEGNSTFGGPPPEDGKESNDADNSKIDDSHPGLQPQDLPGYLKGQEEQLDKYGPEQEKAVMQNVMQGYKKPGFVASEGLAGLGDAIMQGVSRAGPGQALGTIERGKEGNIKNTQDMMAHLQETNAKTMAEKRNLEGMTSTSPIGKSYVDSLQPIAKKLFPEMTDEQWTKISQNPAALEKMLGPAVDIKKVEGELAMRDAMLGATSQHYKAEERNQVSQRKEEETKQKMDALKETAKHTVLHPFESRDAQKELARMGQGEGGSQPHGIPELGSTFNGQKVLKVTKVK